MLFGIPRQKNRGPSDSFGTDTHTRTRTLPLRQNSMMDCADMPVARTHGLMRYWITCRSCVTAGSGRDTHECRCTLAKSAGTDMRRGSVITRINADGFTNARRQGFAGKTTFCNLQPRSFNTGCSNSRTLSSESHLSYSNLN